MPLAFWTEISNIKCLNINACAKVSQVMFGVDMINLAKVSVISELTHVISTKYVQSVLVSDKPIEADFIIVTDDGFFFINVGGQGCAACSIQG